MTRNPKDFGVWFACPSGVHSVITALEMLPLNGQPLLGEEVKFSPQGMPFEKTPYHFIGVDIPARPSLGNAMRKNSR